MQVGTIIKDRRKKNNMTQEQLSNELFVTRQLISKWENGKSYPNLEQIIQLSYLFKVSLDELIKGDKKMQTKINRDLKIKKYFFILLSVLIVLIINAFMGKYIINYHHDTNIRVSNISIIRNIEHNGDINNNKDWNSDISAEVSSKNPFLKPIKESFLVKSKNGNLTLSAQYYFSIFNIFSPGSEQFEHNTAIIDNKINNKDIKVNNQKMKMLISRSY